MSQKKTCIKGLSAVLLCGGVFFTTAFAPISVSIAHAQSLTTYNSSVPREAAHDLKLAKKYAKERRYELARQHYLLALASSNTAELRDSIQRELQVIDLKIRTLR